MSATPEQIAEAVDGIAEWSAISDGDEACLHRAASFIRAQAARVRVLESVLSTLGKACANYRAMHDRLGAGHLDTGRAWDEMRRAENQALAVFADRAALKAAP